MLLKFSDIYLQNPGVFDQHILRGEIVKVVPARRREYQEGMVLSFVLREIMNKSKRSASMKEVVVSHVPPINNQKEEEESEEENNSDSDDFELEDEKENKKKKKQQQEEEEKQKQQGQLVTTTTATSTTTNASGSSSSSSSNDDDETLLRVFLYDDFASAVDFASVGDVLELRTQFRVFLNPDAQGVATVVGKRHFTEHLVAGTKFTDISVFSKTEEKGEMQDIIELVVNPKKLGDEPTAKVSKTAAQWWC